MKFLTISINIILLSFVSQNTYANKKCCQFYNLIIENIQAEYINSTVDSLPPGQKIDPVNPEKTKTYSIKREIYLDFYVSPNLFILSPKSMNGWYGELLKLNSSSVKVQKVENPDLKLCILDSLIVSRFEESKTLNRFDMSFYREEIINGRKILRNPFKVIFSNVLYLKDGRAIVYAETNIGTSPGNFAYGYIFKKMHGKWKIEKSSKFSH